MDPSFILEGRSRGDCCRRDGFLPPSSQQRRDPRSLWDPKVDQAAVGHDQAEVVVPGGCNTRQQALGGVGKGSC